jgi:hypothetical protein
VEGEDFNRLSYVRNGMFIFDDEAAPVLGTWGSAMCPNPLFSWWWLQRAGSCPARLRQTRTREGRFGLLGRQELVGLAGRHPSLSSGLGTRAPDWGSLL